MNIEQFIFNKYYQPYVSTFINTDIPKICRENRDHMTAFYMLLTMINVDWNELRELYPEVYDILSTFIDIYKEFYFNTPVEYEDYQYRSLCSVCEYDDGIDWSTC